MFGGRLSSSIGLVGIDLGTRAIKMLQLREHSRGLRVVGAGRIDVPPGGIGEAIVSRLRGAFASGGFTGRRCVVSLPRSDVRVQSVRLPRMPDEELYQAAVWEASQRFGFERSGCEVDVVRTGAELQGGEGREEILLIAASHERINAWVEPILEAGLRPVAIETHFTALARAVSRPASMDPTARQVRAVVDVGASGSTVLILRGGEIAFCKPINIGGEHLDHAVAEHLQISVDDARELRAARIAAATGQPVASPARDASVERAEYDAVRPLLGGFAKEVILCFRYYGVTFRGHPPESLILTGGDGMEPRLAETLAEHCKIPIEFDEPGTPLVGLVDEVQRVMQRPSGPAAWWAVAAGLSLRGLSRGRLQRVQATTGREAA